MRVVPVDSLLGPFLVRRSGNLFSVTGATTRCGQILRCGKALLKINDDRMECAGHLHTTWWRSEEAKESVMAQHLRVEGAVGKTFLRGWLASGDASGGHIHHLTLADWCTGSQFCSNGDFECSFRCLFDVLNPWAERSILLHGDLELRRVEAGMDNVGEIELDRVAKALGSVHKSGDKLGFAFQSEQRVTTLVFFRRFLKNIKAHEQQLEIVVNT